MKIGLFFGSFDPIHIGHLALANYFVEFSDIDKLWFVLSPQNPFKKKDELLDDSLRLEMVKLAIDKYPQKYYVSDIEFNMPKPSYTVDTMRYLRTKYAQYEFVILMGSDNLKSLNKWKKYKEIVSNHKIYVYPRPKTKLNNLEIDADYKIFDAPKLDISSSFIREAIANGKKVPFFLPAPVAEFIDTEKLYKPKK